MQKPTKKSRNNAFLAEKRLTAALGPGCCRFESCHSDQNLCFLHQKISPFRKIRTDFLSILYNSLSHQKATVFCPNAMFRHKTPVLSIYDGRFLKISFSLLYAMHFLRADRLISASPHSMSKQRYYESIFIQILAFLHLLYFHAKYILNNVRFAYFARCSVSNDLTIAHHGELIRKIKGEWQIVHHGHDPLAVIGKLF